MIKFEVPEDDQSVYEIRTKSGKSYLVRCPGTISPESDEDGMFALQIGVIEKPVCIQNPSIIESFTRRDDIEPPAGCMKLRSMGDLWFRQPGEGIHGFLLIWLE